MKKQILFLLFSFLSIVKTNAQDNLWQPYPINVASYTDGIGERLVFSVYDSTLSITQYDTSVYDPSGGSFPWTYNGTGIVNYNVLTFDLYYIVYDFEKHAFAKGFQSPIGAFIDGSGGGNWAIIRDDIGGGPEDYTLIYYNIITGQFESTDAAYSGEINYSFNGSWSRTVEYGGAIDAGDAETFRRGMSGSGGSWNENGQSPSLNFADNIMLGYEDYNFGFNNHAESANSNYFAGGVRSEGLGVCDPSVVSKNGYAFLSSCDSTNIYIDDNWLQQWRGFKFYQTTGLKSKRLLKDGIAVFVPDTTVTTMIYCAAYNTTTHNWIIDSTSSTGVKNLAITNGTVTWQDNALTSFQRGYDNTSGWSTTATPLYLNFYTNAFDTITEGNLIYVRNYSIGTEATTFSFPDGFTTTQKSTSRMFKINGTYYSQPGTIQVCISALGQTVCQNSVFTRCGNPSANVVATSPNPVCAGGTVNLVAYTNFGISFQWKLNGSNIAGATASTYGATQAGNYSCQVTSGCNATTNLSNTVVVSVGAITITSPSTTICTPSSVLLTAPQIPGNSYQWKLNNSNISGAVNATYSATAAGSYTCEVTNTCGSATSNAIVISVLTQPTANVTPSGATQICIGNSITFNVTTGAGNSYQWYKTSLGLIAGATNSSYSETPSTPSFYWCVVTNINGCTKQSNSSQVSIISIPLISPQGPTTFCPGGSVVINGGSGDPGTYQWQLNGANISGATSTSYTATAAGSYTLVRTFTAGGGCSLTSAPVVVTISTLAAITAGSSTLICPGGNINMTLTANNGTSYQWKLNGNNISGATSQTYIATGVGNYTCVVTSSCGTFTSNILSITFNVSVIPTGNISICAGQSQIFTANALAGVTYQWRRNNVNIAGATNQTYTTTTAGTYDFFVSNGSCVVYPPTAAALTINPQPTATATASTPLTVCNGGGVVFNANAGAGLLYQWQKNGTNVAGATNISYTATTAGAYRVTVTGANGCTKNSTALTAAFTGTSVTSAITLVGPATYCIGAGTYLKETTSIPGYSYQWQLNAVDISGATLTTYTPTASGTYTVRVSATCGSALSAQQIITVNPIAVASISASGSTTICNGSSVFLNAQTGTGYAYQWQLNGSNISGATTNSYQASAAGNYTCIVTNTCGSVTSNSITVSIGGSASASITTAGNTALCGGATVQLDANTGAGLSYQWQLNGVDISGATAPSYVASTAGNYTCNVTSICGTAASNVIAVTAGTVPAQPDPIVGITQSCVPINNVTFSVPAVAGATSYNWYSLNPAVTVNPPGNGTTVTVNLGTTTASTWTLRCEPNNACGAGVYRGITVRRTTSGVSTITGSTLICSTTNGVAYFCNAVVAADDYLWTMPTGATIASGQGTTNITVNFSAAFNGGSICASTRLNCGFVSNPLCKAITKGATAVPGAIVGATTVCSGSSYNFTTALFAGYSYVWTPPANATVTSGAGTNSVTIAFASNYSSGDICVQLSSVCGLSPLKCRTIVSTLPSRPSAITGQTSGLCNTLQSYTSAVSNGSTSYLWNVTGGTIQTGQGTQTISVQWNSTGTTGSLSVNGVNACGNGLVRTVAVNLKPGVPGNITGNIAACANTNEVYTIPALTGATNYQWGVNTSSGATVIAGQGTNSATIHWVTNGGTITCTPSNACSSTNTRVLAVNITCRQANPFSENLLQTDFDVAAIPNPFNSELTINSTLYGDGVMFSISDMLGRIISSQPLTTSNFTLSTSNLHNGVYFVEVNNGSERKVVKVVKAE